PTFATRIYYWPDTTLEDEAVAMLYGRDEGQRCIITADAAKLISGVLMSSGAAWVRPDYRRRGLSQLLPRIAKAYAVSRWPIDWTFGFVTRVTKPNVQSIGQRDTRSEEHTSELQSRRDLVCRLLLEKTRRRSSSDRA